jgi:MFS family permease
MSMQKASTPRPRVRAGQGPDRPEQSRLVSVIALLLSVTLLTAGTNLQGVLLPIRRQLEGSSMQQVGLLSSGWSFGFVLACLVVGRMVASVGHVRTFAGLAAVSGSMAMLLLPMNNEAVWIVLRVVIGFCFGGLSLITESWLNERSGSAQRGGIFAAYMTVSLLASLGGTLSLAFLNPMQELPYTLMAVAVVLSIVPVSLARSPVPLPVEPFSIQLLTLYRVSPSGVFGCFAVGLVSGALGGLLPSYGLSMGLSTHGVAALLTAALIGGALAYYPAGALSDRMDRRIIVIVLSGLSIALCGVLVLNPQLSPREVLLVVGAFGFTQYPLYGICVAMTNDRVREQSFSEVASELLIIYGTGTVLGPVFAAGFMHYGGRYLFLFMALVFLVLVAFIAARTRRTARTPREMKIKSHPLETAPNSMRMFRPRE